VGGFKRFEKLRRQEFSDANLEGRAGYVEARNLDIHRILARLGGLVADLVGTVLVVGDVQCCCGSWWALYVYGKRT